MNRLLLVDDEPHVLNALRRELLLENRRLGPRSACSGMTNLIPGS